MAPLLTPAHHDGAIRVPRRHPSTLSPALLEALSFDRRSTDFFGVGARLDDTGLRW
jgi:hypothetical protein